MNSATPQDGPPATPAAKPRANESQLRKLADNPYAVIALIFCVTGCLGIPVILICRGFSPLMKVVWIVISLVYTAILFYLVWALFYYFTLPSIRSAFS